MTLAQYRNPIDTPVDKARIAGQYTPGVCEVIGAGSPRNYEELGGAGWSGALVVFRGLKPAHFSLQLTLTETSDWNAWDKFEPLVRRPPFGKLPQALDVVHPFLSRLGITSMVIEDTLAPNQTDSGIWMIELKCIESRKLKPGSAAIDGSAATPVDPREAKIEKLTARLAALIDAAAGEGNAP